MPLTDFAGQYDALEGNISTAQLGTTKATATPHDKRWTSTGFGTSSDTTIENVANGNDCQKALDCLQGFVAI
jgi:hypothetical protein